MGYLTEKYDYKKVLFFFEQLTKIPHGSGNVDAISDFVADFGRKHGLRVIQDQKKNVVIFLPATKGLEDRPAVMMQGHMDMVCEKDMSCNHDFTKDALDLYIDADDNLRARGTTLGGDDGIAVAMMMALIDDEQAVHPALELVFTVDEETGMFGAQALDTSVLSAKYLINLDSEEEGYCFLGCAGGVRTDIELPVTREHCSGTEVNVKITGLTGGHSGVEIDKNRTNANKLMGRLLFELREFGPFGLIGINGGKLDNAIPRECVANLVVSDAEGFIARCVSVAEALKGELVSTEPDLQITVTSGASGEFMPLSAENLNRALFILVHTPNGIQKMSGYFKGLVESSLNMGVVSTSDNNMNFRFSLRSSVPSYKDFMIRSLKDIAKTVGATVSTEGDYPAWSYKADSVLRDKYKELYTQEYGKEPVLLVMHAGLECGLLSDKMPGLDIISIGPDMKDVHTPNESLSLESAIRFFKFIEKLLINI